MPEISSVHKQWISCHSDLSLPFDRCVLWKGDVPLSCHQSVLFLGHMQCFCQTMPLREFCVAIQEAPRKREKGKFNLQCFRVGETFRFNQKGAPCAFNRPLFLSTLHCYIIDTTLTLYFFKVADLGNSNHV